MTKIIDFEVALFRAMPAAEVSVVDGEIVDYTYPSHVAAFVLEYCEEIREIERAVNLNNVAYRGRNERRSRFSEGVIAEMERIELGNYQRLTAQIFRLCYALIRLNAMVQQEEEVANTRFDAAADRLHEGSLLSGPFPGDINYIDIDVVEAVGAKPALLPLGWPFGTEPTPAAVAKAMRWPC